MSKAPLSVVLPTLNSAAYIARTVKSVLFADDVLVLDGNSTDGTPEIARKLGARIEPQSDDPAPNLKCRDFSAMKNRGISLAKHDWVLMLDSDEYLTEALQAEIKNIVNDPNPEFLIYEIPRHYTYKGHEIEAALGYPFWAPWLWHKSVNPVYVKKIHEQVRCDDGFKKGRTRNFILAPQDLLTRKQHERKWRKYARMDVTRHSSRSVAELFRYDILGNLKNVAKKSLKLAWVMGSTVFAGKMSLPMWMEVMRIRYYVWIIQNALDRHVFGDEK